VGGTIDNTGMISLEGSGETAALSITGMGVTLTGGGVIVMNNDVLQIGGEAAGSVLDNVNNTISGAGVIGAGVILNNGSAGAIEANGSYSSGQGEILIDSAGQTIVNDGLLQANGASGGGGELVIKDSTVDQLGGGTILGAPGQVTLEDVSVIGGTVGSTGGRAIPVMITGSSDELDGLTSPVIILGEVKLPVAGTARSPATTALTIEGTIHDEGVIALDADRSASTVALIVGAQGATLSGDGLLSLSPSTMNVVEGVAASSTLTNDERIVGGGDLGGGELSLVNATTGVINGDATVGLTINAGSTTIASEGTITATGTGGVTIKSAIDNTGVVSAAYGNLTIDGEVTGDGRAVVNSATLDFASSFNEYVSFTANPFSTSVLELADSQTYGGTISGFSKTGATELELDDIGFVSSTEATFVENSNGKSGILTVTYGIHTAQIHLLGNYDSSTFVASSNGEGGTFVTDPINSSTRIVAARFAASAAAFDVPRAASPTKTAEEFSASRFILTQTSRANV